MFCYYFRYTYVPLSNLSQADKQAAGTLANIAKIDITLHATEMFRAGSALQDKTEEEVFYQDFKKFSTEDINFTCWASFFYG